MNGTSANFFGEPRVGPLGAWEGDAEVSAQELAASAMGGAKSVPDAVVIGTVPGASILSMVLEGEREAWKQKPAVLDPVSAPAPAPAEELPSSPFDLARVEVSQAVIVAHEDNVRRSLESRARAAVQGVTAEFTFKPDIGAFEAVVQDRSVMAALAALGPTFKVKIILE